MKKHNPAIPYRMAEFIKEHFREDFLFEVKEVSQKNGHWYYTVEVAKDNYTHTLRFNEAGELIQEEADETFPPDDHDEPATDNRA